MPHRTMKTEQGQRKPVAAKSATSPVWRPSGSQGSIPGLPFFLQPKLATSQPGDPLELEADRVADQVMRMSVPTVQRQCAACEEEEAVTVSRKAQGATRGDAPASVDSVLRAPGQPLSSSARAFFEPRFGRDLGEVRIHTDQAAQQSAQAVNALAYTVGSHVVFGADRYVPGTPDGQRLLAHELTHTIQQRNRSTLIQRQAIPDDMKLPCKWGDYSFEDNKIGDIRILVGMATKDRNSLPSLKGIAAQIEKDNKIISDPKFQVKNCIISYVTTRFALYEGEPVLMIDASPTYANVETISHEMGHAVYHFMRHNKGVTINGKITSDDVISNVADIFVQLKGISLTNDDKNQFSANWLVDPSIWSPGAEAEHPTDIDEFFASAKAAYQLNGKKLEAAFAKYGKQDKKVIALGNRLTALFGAIFSGSKLKSETISSDKTAIEEQIRGISEPTKVEDTLSAGINVVVSKLLDPQRKQCKQIL